MNCQNGSCRQGRRPCATPLVCGNVLRRTTTDSYEHEPLPRWVLWSCWAVFGTIGLDLLIQFARGAL